MKDPTHLANHVLHTALLPFFEGRLPPDLGRELLSTIRKRLCAEGLQGDEHAEEIFARVLMDAVTYLKRHGGTEVEQPRAWLHAISRNVTYHYLMEASRRDIPSVVAALEGERELLGANLQNEERILQLVREAISSLPPRFQEFIVLDMVERREPQEIREKMNIPSEPYFQNIKCEAFSALRAALSSLVQKGIDSLL